MYSILMSENDPKWATYIEVVYMTFGRLVDFREFRQRFNNLTTEEARDAWLALAEPIKNRLGLDLEPLPSLRPVKNLPSDDLDLNPIFVLAVGEICSTIDKRTTGAKLKALGITPKQFSNLLKIPKHKAYFDTQWAKAYGNTEVAAEIGISRLVESGDLQAIKHFQEMKGIYKPNSELTLNLGAILAVMMEILAKHVSIEVLGTVADELDQALNSQGALTA